MLGREVPVRPGRVKFCPGGIDAPTAFHADLGDILAFLLFSMGDLRGTQESAKGKRREEG
jgi:hypothetical protein